jgi:hypothetical protein
MFAACYLSLHVNNMIYSFLSILLYNSVVRLHVMISGVYFVHYDIYPFISHMEILTLVCQHGKDDELPSTTGLLSILDN